MLRPNIFFLRFHMNIRSFLSNLSISQLLLFLSAIPFVTGTFFPFTLRQPSLPPSRYGYRSSRSSPNNLVPVDSPILGLRVYVPRGLFDLFNMRPPTQPGNNLLPRPYPYNPQNFYPPNGFAPQNFPQNRFPPNRFPPQNFPPTEYPPRPYPPNGIPQPPFPPVDAGNFINLMRALYPDMIYRPDPRFPNVFAIRFPSELQPPTHLPDARPSLNEFYEEGSNQSSPNQFYNQQSPTNANPFLSPQSSSQNFSSRNYSERQQPPPYNRSPQLLIIGA